MIRPTRLRYKPEMDIRNLDALQHGTGARFLKCIRGEGPELVAKSWHRKKPSLYGFGEVSVDFGR